MSNVFKQDESGNWYNSETGYYLGTHQNGEFFFQHLIDDGAMSAEDVVNFVMESVNDSMSNENPVCYTGTKPEYMSAGAAGADLRADEDYIIWPGKQVVIETNTAMSIPNGYFGMAVPRSSLCNKKGLRLVNSVGIIDEDYRGTIKFVYENTGVDIVEVVKGERIGQIVLTPYVRASFVEVESLDETERGEGGFGSSGE